jgi:predicted amino acid-binding ACT domain protein
MISVRLQVGFLIIAAISYTIAYHSFNIAKIAETIFYTVLVDWLLVGVVNSTVCW